jgi:chromosome partitioning protein
MAKILVFTNRKGGTGKSTLCIQFANFLVAHGHKVAVLDSDPQQSIVDLRNREMATNPDVTLPWSVQFLNDNIHDYMKQAKAMDDGFILVDCPGTITPSLLPAFHAADAVVIPFRYDDFIVSSTISFVKVLRKAGVTSPLMFLPNNIDIRIKNASEDRIKEILREVGVVLPRVKQGVAVQRCSTIRPLDKYQDAAVKYCVEELLVRL